jgi:hypoxanthine phosphoribosyltransferase
MATREVPPVVKRIMISEETISERVKQLASEINEHYKGKEVVIVGILKGSFLFMADLCRFLAVDNTVDFMSLSSYGESATSSGNVRIIMDMRRNISGKHVLLIEGEISKSKAVILIVLQILLTQVIYYSGRFG